MLYTSYHTGMTTQKVWMFHAFAAESRRFYDFFALCGIIPKPPYLPPSPSLLLALPPSILVQREAPPFVIRNHAIAGVIGVAPAADRAARMIFHVRAVGAFVVRCPADLVAYLAVAPPHKPEAAHWLKQASGRRVVRAAFHAALYELVEDANPLAAGIRILNQHERFMRAQQHEHIPVLEALVHRRGAVGSNP